MMNSFQKIIVCLLDVEKDNSSSVLTRFQEFLEYEDVLFHLLRVLGKTCKSRRNASEKFLSNLIQVLEHVTMFETSDQEKSKLFCSGKQKCCAFRSSKY